MKIWNSAMGRSTGHFDHRPPTETPSVRQTALSRYLAPLKPGRGVLLWGDHLRGLAAAAAAWGVARGAQVLVVDAANRFDPHQLVRESAHRHLPPGEALSRVRVARAFTSHQLVRLLKETFPAHLAPGSLVLVLGPVSLFYDEQVPLQERRRLFRELVGLQAGIKTRAALLLLQPRLPRAAANRHVGRLLAPVLDSLVEVEGPESHSQPTPLATPPVLPSPPGALGRGRRHRASSPFQRGDL